MKKWLIGLLLTFVAVPIALSQVGGGVYGESSVTAASIAAALGYTPANKAGDTFGGAVTVTGTTTPTGGVKAAGGFTISPRSFPNAVGIASASLTPSTTTTYITQVFLPANATITGISVRNGTLAGGNITVGLADSTGAPIAAAKSASTAQSGTAIYQDVPFAAPYVAVGPATYYVQVQYSAATAAGASTYTQAAMATATQTSGTYGTFVSFTPPTTFTASSGICVGLY